MGKKESRVVEITCRRCKVVWDVTGMASGKPFKCECGALNRVPKPPAPPIGLIAAGIGAVVVVVVLAFVFLSGGDGNGEKRTPKEAKEKKADKAGKSGRSGKSVKSGKKTPSPKPKPKPKPPEKPDLLTLQYEKLKKKALKEDATAEDVFKLADFCDRKGRRKYRKEVKRWAELTVKLNPRHEYAHEMLDHVEFLGVYVTEEEKRKRLEDPWIKKAYAVRERKFLQDQQLRDLGLVYNATMPFVIAKERNDDLPLRDKWELQELGAILQGTYYRFHELFGKRFKLKPFDGSRGDARAIPVFWFDTEKSFRRAWSQVRGLKRDVSEFAAAFYAPGDENELMEMMIYGYRNRRARSRSFDNGKIAHEASHALEDFYQKPLGKRQEREASGTWWFSEGLAEYIGSVHVKTIRNKDDRYQRSFEVKFLTRNQARMRLAKVLDVRFMVRARFEENDIGVRVKGIREETDPRDWPFDLKDLLDLRNGMDLNARAEVMYPGDRRIRGLIGSLAYFEAWSLVAFMFESGGDYREALMRCFDARRNNKAHKVVNQVTFKDIDLEDLEEKWLAWIKQVLKKS